MTIEEHLFEDQGVAWQRLFNQAQATWMAGDYDVAGEHFSQLRQETTPLLLSIAAQNGPATLAEDIVAEAYLELYRAMSTGKPVDNVAGLLATIVKRRAIDQLRRAVHKQEQPAQESFWARYAEDGAVSGQNVEDEVTRRLSALGLLNPILDELPPHLRQVLFARHGAEMTVDEAARHLGLTVDQVKKRTREALARAQAIAHEKGLLP